jgi:hypothetical protein
MALRVLNEEWKLRFPRDRVQDAHHHIVSGCRGVLLPNGWDHDARHRADRHFQLNWEMEERHRLHL